MDMKYDTRLDSSSVDAILVVFADLFTKKANKRKTFPCAVAITLCEFRGSRHAWVNKPIKAEYSNFYRLAPCLRVGLVSHHFYTS